VSKAPEEAELCIFHQRLVSFQVQLLTKQMQSSSRPPSTSTRPPASPHPRQGHPVNTQTKVLDTNHGRILCIADIRGRLSALNDLAREANAKAIIHTGDFGFFGMYFFISFS
jgi:hypothetical protein